MHAHTHTRTHTYARMHAYSHVHTHTLKHTHTHKYIHIHFRELLLNIIQIYLHLSSADRSGLFARSIATDARSYNPSMFPEAAKVCERMSTHACTFATDLCVCVCVLSVYTCMYVCNRSVCVCVLY